MTENEIINRLHLHGETMTQDEAFFIMDALEEIQQYRAIGTVEDITDGIKQSEEEFNMLTEYLKIGTIDEFKDLKEKNVAKKPLRVPTDDTCLYYEFRCPSCGGWLSEEIKRTHCKCNQKLDWQ